VPRIAPQVPMPLHRRGGGPSASHGTTGLCALPRRAPKGGGYTQVWAFTYLILLHAILFYMQHLPNLDT